MNETYKEKLSTNSSKKSGLKKLTFHKLNWLEWISIVLCLWFWIFPFPYKPLFIALLLMPIVGLILNGLNGRPSIASLVEITANRKGDDKYDVADFIDLPAFAILIRVLLDYEFENFYSLILPGTIAFILMIVFLVITHSTIVKTAKSKIWIYSSLIFSIFLYSCSATYGINCAFDNSTPTIYQTELLDKRISRGRRLTTYYIKVKPWGAHKESEEISVPKYQFDNFQTGDPVYIDLRKGVFNIPWYQVE